MQNKKLKIKRKWNHFIIFNSKFLISKKPIVVVEIGNDWLKIVESESTTSGSHITKVSFTKLAQIKELISDTISKIFSDLKLGKQRVITYIPRHLATVRILELPSTDPKEVSNMVSLQVGKQTPYTKEEIISDHKIVDAGREGYTKVMLAIVRHNIISERVEALQKAGIEVEKIALSSEGVYNWFNTVYMPDVELEDFQAVALVDIDSNYSDFIIVKRKKLVFTRSLLIGANQLLGDSEGWQDKFIEELKHSIELYQSGEKDIKIVKIFLSGAGRNIKDLEHLLSSRLDVPAETTYPLRNIQIKEELNIFRDDNFKFVSISALIGAAMEHGELALDLTPPGVRIQKLMEEKRKQLTIMSVLVASIVMTASIFLLANIYNKNIYLTQLKQKITKIKTASTELEKMRLIINLVERRLDAKGASINILNEIYKLTLKEISLISINIDETNQVVLKGRAFAMSDVFKFITTLENSPYFENVKTTYTTTKKEEEDIEYAEFEIICAYENKN